MGGVDPEHGRARADHRVQGHDPLVGVLCGQSADEVDLGTASELRADGVDQGIALVLKRA